LPFQTSIWTSLSVNARSGGCSSREPSEQSTATCLPCLWCWFRASRAQPLGAINPAARRRTQLAPILSHAGDFQNFQTLSKAVTSHVAPPAAWASGNPLQSIFRCLQARSQAGPGGVASIASASRRPLGLHEPAFAVAGHDQHRGVTENRAQGKLSGFSPITEKGLSHDRR